MTRNGTSLVLTHGHYFQQAWAFLGEWVPQLLDDADLRALYGLGCLISSDPKLTVPSLKPFVAMNHPVNLFLSSGIGMAGPFTWLARKIQRLAKDIANEAAAGKTDTPRMKLFRGYLERADDRILDDLVDAPCDKLFWAGHLRGLKEKMSDRAIEFIKEKVLSTITGYHDEPGSSPAPTSGVRRRYDDEMHRRMQRYLTMSDLEIRRISQAKDGVRQAVDVPYPTHMVFGDTHGPIAFGEETELFDVGGRRVGFSNTGSFLCSRDASGAECFSGGEVVVYETAAGIRSTRVT